MKHGFTPKIFCWIDFCCIDQHNLRSATPLLPLWVACCERFLRIETTDYLKRAWCRSEPFLSYVVQFADHQMIINLDFRCSITSFHLGEEKQVLILDLSSGKSTDPADLTRIKSIVDLTRRTQIEQNRKTVNFGATTIECFQL